MQIPNLLIFILINKKKNLVLVMKLVQHVIMVGTQMKITVLLVKLIIFLNRILLEQLIVLQVVYFHIITQILDNTDALQVHNVQMDIIFL